jgi:hypothetical protein
MSPKRSDCVRRFAVPTTGVVLAATMVLYFGCSSTEEPTLPPPAAKAEKAGPITAGSVTLDDVRSILKPREVEVEILDAQPPEDIARIQKTVQESVTANQKWFAEYVLKGKSLTYHPNFGVTEAEFNRYMDFWRDKRLVPVRKGRLKFTAQSDSKTLIENVDGLSKLNGIVVDFERNQVSTTWGTASADTPIHTTEKSATGSSDQYSWRMEKGGTESSFGTMVWFNVGRLSQTPHNIINFRACTVPGGTKDVDTVIQIRFPK